MSQNILRLPAVKAAIGLSRSTIYLHISQGLLPKPICLGVRAVGWPFSEVTAIIDARISGKTDEEIRTLVVKLESSRKAVI